ncbi:pentapeptide repeat-containing protein [Trichothermofontia sp.]
MTLLAMKLPPSPPRFARLPKRALFILGISLGLRVVLASLSTVAQEQRGCFWTHPRTGRSEPLGSVCQPPTLNGSASTSPAPLTSQIRHILETRQCHNCYLRQMNLSKLDLSGTDLLGADLSEANLAEANLTYTNLRDAKLTTSILRGANLSSADLRRVDLSHADLRGANLSGANLSGANLSHTRLDGVNWCNAILPSGFMVRQMCSSGK